MHSGTLLLFNKIVLVLIPSSSFVTACQFLYCIIGILAMNFLHIVTIDKITGDVIKKYGMYTVMFVAGIYTNMQALKFSNVDTVIVFRSATPIAVSMLDFLFLGRQFPSLRSLGALFVILFGSCWYVSQDETSTVQSYTWAFAYLCIISVEMAYGKMLVRDISISLTTSVFVSNLFAFLPMVLLGYSRGDFDNIDPEWFTPSATTLLLISCVVSGGIGYSAWWCRTVVSATTFTLVGVLCKISTILLNILIWDKHASPMATLGLMACLLGGSLYQQAPLRNEKPKPISPV